MFKLLQILIAISLLLALCAAEAPRQRSSRLQQHRRRFAARQVLLEQQEPTAVTPYPAAGLKPEVPFDLPNEVKQQQQPDNTYLPPDNTYGPPPADLLPEEAAEDEAAEDIDAAAADAEEDAAEVGSTPGEQPAGAEQDADNEVDDNADIIPVVDPRSGRLVLGRRVRLAKSGKLLLPRRQLHRSRLVRL